MKTKTTSRLRLSRETLRKMSTETLGNVVGGIASNSDSRCSVTHIKSCDLQCATDLCL